MGSEDLRGSPLWRPTFKPKWWDFLFPVGAFFLTLPLVIWHFWTSGFPVAAFIPLAVAFITGLLAAALLLVFWRASGPGSKILQRTLLQVAMTGLVALLLVMTGMITHKASIRASMRRGDEIIAELTEYRKHHLRYTSSLEALQESVGRSLPRPSIDDAFYYRGGWRSFKLGFSYGILNGKLYDSRKGHWDDGWHLF